MNLNQTVEIERTQRRTNLGHPSARKADGPSLHCAIEIEAKSED